MFSTDAHAAAAIIKQKVPTFQPKLGLILGSGLGNLAERIQNPHIIPYEDLPGFFPTTIAGHSGNLYLGMLEGYPVACLQGRAHLYEGITANVIQTIIRTLKLIGCEKLLLTNSAGSLRSDMPTGTFMSIADHINFQFTNALVGPNDETLGPRFFSMENAYDKGLRKSLLQIAQQNNIKMTEGVYVGVLGPAFETPAEIRAYKILGADAVGMSTVQEVIVARHCNLKVAAVSAITNMAAGMNTVELSHEQTLQGAANCLAKFTTLVLAFVKSLANDKK